MTGPCHIKMVRTRMWNVRCNVAGGHIVSLAVNLLINGYTIATHAITHPPENRSTCTTQLDWYLFLSLWGWHWLISEHSIVPICGRFVLQCLYQAPAVLSYARQYRRDSVPLSQSCSLAVCELVLSSCLCDCAICGFWRCLGWKLYRQWSR